MADLSNTIKGSYYMKTGEYSQAEVDFEEAVKKHPDSKSAQYYLGRFLLAQNKATEALSHFERAVVLDPGDADYHSWLGITYGELGDVNAEEKSYERALRLNGHHLQVRLYLGHGRLRKGNLRLAIEAYDAVLIEQPTNPAALYNRAFILDIQRKYSAAKMAWLKYLHWYPAGRFALQATDHLNALGDFSYENQFIGDRAITLAEIKFQQSRSSVSQSSYPPLRLIGAIVSNLPKGTLQVVVCVHNNKQLVKERAIENAKTGAMAFINTVHFSRLSEN
ncbi:tetratricopeptide repeat protein [Desulforhopalus sp. IMCC35007]|uniref:tetratricopeptide repeat protein n=1 Tax=Desulforhopalus sp. IMCC35007 TaxID=2569543 RepID=UPI0010AEDC0B|nr:tetratricopeptide repeat protein [Desulforhopalus sp. IMCC35007]TKB11331.1 tetratricopeptide repeat protein [Desulforhopalus sp. IMCC35007]